MKEVVELNLRDLQTKMDKLEGKVKESKPYYVDIPSKPSTNEIPMDLDDSKQFVNHVYNLGKKKSEYRDVFSDIDDIKYKMKKKKAKKKRKKKGKYTNYEAIFASDLSELKQLRDEQHRFTQELQKKFDSTVGKSTYRGINKYESDLTIAIIQSRSLEAQIDERISRIKETMYKMKATERKELASIEAKRAKEMASDDEAFASSLMMNLMANRSQIQQPQETHLQAQSPNEPNIDDFLNEHLSSPNPYIQHESDGIKQIVETTSDGSYKFRTFNKRTGEEIRDYPEPITKSLRFVEDQMLAKDEYGTQYEWHKK